MTDPTDHPRPTRDDIREALPAGLAFTAGLVVNLAHRPVPEFDIYIGRTFAGRVDEGFGNPLRLRDDTPAGRARLIADYWAWLNGPSVRARRVRGRIRAGELTGRVLGCWCAGRGFCHGHILAALAAGAVEQARAWAAELDIATRP